MSSSSNSSNNNNKVGFLQIPPVIVDALDIDNELELGLCTPLNSVNYARDDLDYHIDQNSKGYKDKYKSSPAGLLKLQKGTKGHPPLPQTGESAAANLSALLTPPTPATPATPIVSHGPRDSTKQQQQRGRYDAISPVIFDYSLQQQLPKRPSVTSLDSKSSVLQQLQQQLQQQHQLQPALTRRPSHLDLVYQQQQQQLGIAAEAALSENDETSKRNVYKRVSPRYQPEDNTADVSSYLNTPNTQKLYIQSMKIRFFNLGLISGATLQMFFICLLVLFFSTMQPGYVQQITAVFFPVFRAIFYLCFFFSLYGICIFIWKRSSISYQSILSVSYAHTHQYVLHGSASLSHIVFSCYVVFVLAITIFAVNSNSNTVDAETPNSSHLVQNMFPLISVILPSVIFFCPYDSLTYPFFGVIKNGFSQRWDLFTEFINCFYSPFIETTFIRSIIGDVLCSMPRAYQDIQYMVCLYSTTLYLYMARGEDTHIDATMRNNSYIFEASHQCNDYHNSVNFVLACILQLLPFYIRFCQCIRAIKQQQQQQQSLDSNPSAVTPMWMSVHFYNSIKYILCLSLALSSKLLQTQQGMERYKVHWIVLGIVSTCYCVFWDVVMDWGLMRNVISSFIPSLAKSSSFTSSSVIVTTPTTAAEQRRLISNSTPVTIPTSNSNASLSTLPNTTTLTTSTWFLRETLIFKSHFYYIAIITNIILRLGWSVVVSPGQPFISQNYVLLLGVMEVVRRFIWLIFRIEYEHVRLSSSNKDMK